MAVKDYIRERFFPHMWCAGCGHGIVLNSMLRAIEKLGMNKNDIVMVSGIGCSSRISGYVDFHTLHTIHGRALAFATGVKMSRPELNILVPMGDGDALAIGGNHFIHAARRNIDITAVVMNNRIYGMTGGQYSPLSGYGTRATTAPYMNIDHDFDVIELAPTIQSSSTNDMTHEKEKSPFLNFFIHAEPDQVKYSTIQSEEGGRFYCLQNRYMIIEVDETELNRIPENYMWITLGQIMELVKYGYFNIYARSLLACAFIG